MKPFRFELSKGKIREKYGLTIIRLVNIPLQTHDGELGVCQTRNEAM